jgi:hypothetical protein
LTPEITLASVDFPPPLGPVTATKRWSIFRLMSLQDLFLHAVCLGFKRNVFQFKHCCSPSSKIFVEFIAQVFFCLRAWVRYVYKPQDMSRVTDDDNYAQKATAPGRVWSPQTPTRPGRRRGGAHAREGEIFRQRQHPGKHHQRENTRRGDEEHAHQQLLEPRPPTKRRGKGKHGAHYKAEQGELPAHVGVALYTQKPAADKYRKADFQYLRNIGYCGAPLGPFSR